MRKAARSATATTSSGCSASKSSQTASYPTEGIRCGWSSPTTAAALARADPSPCTSTASPSAQAGSRRPCLSCSRATRRPTSAATQPRPSATTTTPRRASSTAASTGCRSTSVRPPRTSTTCSRPRSGCRSRWHGSDGPRRTSLRGVGREHGCRSAYLTTDVHDLPSGSGCADRRHAPASLGLGRIFSSLPGQPRIRRATDLLVLGPVLLVLGLLIIAYPPGDFERSLESFLTSFPGWLDPVWNLVYDLLPAYAVVLLLVVLVKRRRDVLLEALGSLVLALLIGLVSARFATGSWPGLREAIGGGSDAASFPAFRLTLCAAVILAIGAQLVRPLRTLGR